MTSSFNNIKATSINLSKSYVQISAQEKESQGGWIDYGDKNMFAEYCIELSEQSPVHGSLVRSISQMIAGKTITSKDVGAASLLLSLGIVDANNNTANDLELHGGFYWEVIFDMKGEPHSIEHLPFECCRIGVNKATGEVNGIWFSKDWKNIRKKRNVPKFIPLFDGKKQEGMSRQALYSFKNSTSASYYGKPDYISSLNYIEMSRQLSVFHVNNIQNGLFPSFVVNLNNGIPETIEEMDAQKREIEKNISGASNAGKFIVTFNENRDRSAEFIPFPTNDNDKVYQLYEETCTRQIMMSHRVTSPLLFGIREGGGLGSNKDEMETALKIFNEQVVNPSQQLITAAAEEILQMCGVSASVFILNNGEEMSTDVAATATVSATTDATAADVSYNGAQISSAIDIIAKVKEGILTEEQATIFLIQFLQLPEDVAKAFFAGGGAIAVQKLSAHLKKKVKLEIPESFEPTNEMSEEAKLGLKWREEYGRGGTEVGVARARDISNKRNLSFDTVKRMNSYFARHQVDKEASGWNQGEEGFPSAGRIAWLLWGGDAGADWAKRIVDRYAEENLSKNIPEFTQEAEQQWMTFLDTVGEVVDDEEWELLSEEIAGSVNDESDYQLAIKNVNMAYAKPNEPSERDSGLYKLRYKYSENISADSRDFCVKEATKSRNGVVYKFEDINLMSAKGVNGEFAPEGQKSYDIFTWKGGCFCHHSWLRRIYFRKRKNGKFLPNNGLKNDERVKDSGLDFLIPKGKESIRPINTPSRGSLKY